jgi:5-deoxy-glucuronate isomerase
MRIVPEVSGSYTVGLGRDGDSRLAVGRGSGGLRGSTEGAVAWLLVERGSGRLTVDDLSAEVAGRTDVFDEPGWSAIVPPDTDFAVDGDLDVTIVWRDGRFPLPARLIAPDEIAEEDRGSGANARRVRTYVGEGPIIAGETLNPPGGWSSYPPHRHEHEEVYLYRFQPAEGFGVAVMYEDSDDKATVVRDGTVQRISRGYHPVVAAPGYTMYYLWALAGASETLTPEFDPVHAWAAS